ncbi:hypothetical protein AY601_2300 [Pedobacter cryoconitis]|uniref:Uncharacterized protein n=2 Tax=Pedobacter cryoconitis TaxID=188932 RepID=A0A127VD22_9SPHI|nr:hypothetical protein AY601_2300 [Pedobacter cryoconitis]
MNRRGIPAREGLLTIVSVGLFILFALNPFSSHAQFPYDESFRNSTTNKPDVKFGGEPTAFLTALYPITGSVTDAQGEGYLRLTNNKTKQKGYVYSNNVFLGTYGLNIEFEYFTYGGGTNGADGLSFFLFDAAVTDADFNIGGFGGSLGYAQLNKDGRDYKGVSKGYLGIGLDEFGNFSNHGEGRQGNKDQIANSIVLRGAGDGSAYIPTNYPLLTTVKTSTLATDPFNIAGGSRTAKDGEPEYRKVFINLVPRPGGGLLISVSVKHGSVITPVIVKYPYTTPIPAKGLKYGIASSTGDNVNYHEIRGLTLTVDKSVLSQPEAPSPLTNICQGASGSLDILTGATKPNAGGEPNPDNVDLNPLTPEIDRQVVTDAGTFVFDNVNTRLLTYTPKPGFSGSSASIKFTFMDVYGAKSTVGTATFNINSPIITIQPVSSTICENSGFTPTVAATGPDLSYQWQVNTGGGWNVVADPDGSLGSKTNTLNISRVPFTYNGYKYRVQVSSPGGCNVISDIINLTVNQLPTAAISPLKQDVCQDSPDIPVTFSGKYGTGPYTFYYTISDGTVKSAIKTITTTGSNNSTTINHPTNVPGVFTYEIVKVSNSTCSNDLISRSKLTIIPNASVGLAPLSGSAIQNVCVGIPMQSIVYQIKDADEATVSFNKINSDITFVYDAVKQTITISGTSSLVGKFPFTVSTIGGCSTANISGEINVLPNTTIALTSAVKSDQQNVCINNSITQIEYQVTNGKNATVVGLPSEMIWVYNAVTGKFTISGTPATAGLITYTITATGDCQPASITGTINVKPDVSLVLLSGAKDQTMCINVAITPIVYTVANETGATVENLPAGIIWKRENGKITISGTPTATGSLHYKITATGDCQPAIAEGDLTVKPDVSLVLLSGAKDQTICINTAIEPIVYTVANETAVTVVNLPAGVNWIQTGNKVTISGTPTVSGTLHYKITATGGCQPAIAEGDLTVKPDVSLTLLSGAKDQAVCINVAIEPIVYTVANETAVAVVNLPAGVNWIQAGNKVTISGTPTVSGTLHYKITATGNCQPAIAEGDLTVKPNVSLVLFSGAKDQTICINTAIEPIVYTVANETAVAVVNLPAGVNWIQAGNKVTISGTPTVSGTLHYKITATGGCQPAIAEGDLTVKPDVSLTLLSGAKDQAVCINVAIEPIVYTVANETAVAVVNLPAGVNWIHAGNKVTISGTPTVSGTLHYKITATGNCQPAIAEGDLTVKPNVSLVLFSGAKDQTICINTAIEPIVYTVANETAVTVVNLPAGVNWIQAGNKVTISGTPTVSGTLHYKITATGNCQPAIAEGDLTVKPDVSLTLLSGAKDQAVCINTAIEPIVYTVANETAVTVVNLPAGVNWIQAGNKVTINGTPTVSGTLHYKITATGNCQPAIAEGDLTVKPDVSLTLLSGAKDQIVCINVVIEPIVYTVANETAVTVVNLPAGVNWIQAGNKVTISGTPTVSGTLHYKITATGNCLPAIAEGDLTVKPDVSLVLLSGAKDQTICINTAIEPIVYTVANETGATVENLPAGIIWKRENGKITISGRPTATGSLHYKITATGNCQPAIAEGDLTVKPDVSLVLLSGAKDQTICINTAIEPIIYTVANETGATVENLPAGIIWKRENGKITISGTPTVPGTLHYKITATGGCQPAVAEGDLTVKPDVSLVLLSGAKDQTICINVAIEPIVYTVANETAVTVVSLPAGVNWIQTGNKVTISGTPTVSGTLHYKITATGNCQPAIAEGDLTVKPDVSLTLLSGAKNQAVCINTAIEPIVYTVANETAVTVVNLPAGVNWIQASNKVTISGTPTVSGTLHYKITATGNCLPAIAEGDLTVKPDVSLVLLSGAKDQTICINRAIEPIVYTVANETGATVENLSAGIIWKRENGKITISGTPTATGSLHYKITATGDCQSAIAEGDLTVKPDVSLVLLSGAKDQTICINTAIEPIVYTVANETGATVENLPAGIIWKRENGKITISGTPTVPGTLHYKITATGDCQPAIAEGDLTVKPDVSLTLLSGANDQIVCVNVAIEPIVYTVANETAVMVVNLPAGVNWIQAGNKVTISGTPTVSGTLHYKITATGGCQPAIAEGDLTVKPDVSLTLLSGAKNQAVCINVAIEPIVYTVANETAITVVNLPAGVNWIQAGNKVTISGTPTVSGTLHYKITATGNCLPAIAEGDLTVKPDVSLTLLSGAKDQAVCINTAIEPIVYTVANETAVTVVNLPAGVNWIQAGNKVTISGTPTVSGTLHYKITATGDCQPAIAEGDLTVKPNVSLVLLSGAKDQTICINTAIEPIVYTVANETAVTVVNLPAGVNWIQAGNKVTISGTPTVSGTLHYKITATGNCQPAIAEGDLTVKPDVSLTLLSGAKDQAVCINVAIEPIVYTVTNETAVTVVNLPAGVNWIQAGNKVTINGTPTVSGTLHYKITATGNCQPAIAEGDLTVKPNVSLVLLSGAKDQTICINTAIEPIVYTVANETAVTVVNLPAGVNWIQAGNKVTISGTPTVSGTLHYKITATGNCQPAIAEGDLTVKPDVSLVLLSGAKDQTICINTAIEPIVYTVANETVVTVVNLPAGVNWIQAGNKVTISGTPTVSGTLHYKITATGNCQPAIAEGDLTVKPNVSLVLLSGAKDQAICINTAIESIIYTVANETTGATVENLPAGIIWKRENGKITISGTPTVSGALHYKITATGDCQSAIAEGDLTVKPDVSLVLFSGAKDQTICINTAIEPIVYTVANETGATVENLPAGIIWKRENGKITISGTPTVSGTLHYKITATGDCQPAIAEGDLTVKPDVSLTLLSGAKDQTICINVAIEPIVYTVANETAVTVVNLPAGVNWIQAGNKVTINGTPTVSGTLHYKITATGNCQPAIAEGDLTVKPDVSLTLLSGAKDQAVCINVAIEPIVYTVANETAITVVNLPAGVNWIQAGNKVTISGTPTVSGTLHYNITATGGCQPAIAEGDLTVKPDVSLVLLSGAKDQMICINTAIEPIIYTVANATGATVENLSAGIIWKRENGKIIISGTPTLSGALHYKITATGDCQPAIAEGDLTVKPDVSLVLLSGAKDQTICINTAIEPIVYTVTNETGATVENLPAGIIWKRENGKITISGTPTVSGTLHYKITATGDCQPAIAEGDLTVKPDVSLTLLSGAKDQIVCVNVAIEPVVYTVANETGATVENLPAGIIWKRENGKITISGTPTVSGALHYKITATGDCQPAIAEGDLTVKPDVSLVLLSGAKDQIVCINTAIEPIVYTVANETAITVMNLPAGVNWIQAGNKITISGAPTAVGTLNYKITATGDCQLAVVEGNLIVKPDVTIALTSAVNTDRQELCVNKTIVQIEYQTTNGKNATITGLPAGLTSNYDPATGKFTITGTPSTAGLITYTITATGDCKSANITGKILVKPNVELVLTTGSNNQSTCINTPISNATYTVSNGTAIATNLPPGLIQNYANGVLTISGIPSQSGTFLYTIAATGDCGTQELQAQLKVYPNAMMELTSPAGSDQPVLCLNTPVNPIIYKITNATGATTSALPAGLNGTYNPDTKELIITGTPSISGTFPYTVTTTGGCASVTLSGIIQVNPNTTLQLISSSQTASQTLCVNSNNLQTITYQTTNAINATVTGLPAGLMWSYNNNQLKINGVPTQSGTFNYIVSTTGLCQTQQLSGTIIISPDPIGFNDVISSLTCTNNSIQYNLQDNVNNTANGGNSVPATFTWTVAPNNNVRGLNNGSGNNISATLINTSHNPQQIIYTVTPTSVTGGCPGKTFTVTINVPVCSSLTITKTANVNVVSATGDQIQYTITVKNTGTANHTNVQVTDPFLGGLLRGPVYGDNGNGILEANESWVYTGTYRVTQTDIDENGKPNARSGKIINTASLTTAEISTPLIAVATVDIVTSGSIVLVKTGVIRSDFSTIIYTFKITNNGRVKLYNLNLMDTKIGGQINLGTNEIAAGASITVTATYKISDEEKRDGRVVNTATVKGNTPSGDPVSDISGTQANNDEPTVHIIVDAPQALDDKAEVQINQTIVIHIAGNDIASLNGLNKASIENTQPSNGRLDVHTDGTVTYTPNKGYSGKDEFTYYIYDYKTGTPNKSNRATVTITVIPIDLFIPNTITPNGDGKNDTFKIIGRESFDGIELMVFNRWGNEVYRNNNYLDEWDGSGLTEGTYYYVITLKKAGSKVNKNGWILIKR